MTQQKTLLTAGDFFRLYSHRDGRYELVQGEVVEMAPVNNEHGEVASNIDTAFNLYSRERGSGRARVETGYRLRQDPDTLRSPDVSYWISAPRGVDARTRSFVSGAPDIAVEVVSPSDTAGEIEQKVHEYLEAGSQRVWVVYPATRSVRIHRPDGTAMTYAGDHVIGDEELLPGFSLPLAEVFD